ncbi:hypothetical protein Tco_0379240, partial [Tanacetum coccineum]
KKLGLSPPPALATFGMTAEDKKKKRTKILKEDFVPENVTVDGMHRNLVPPPGIEGRKGLVLRNLSRGFSSTTRIGTWSFNEKKNSIWPPQLS